MCPTTCRVPSIIFLIATACRSCEFPFLVHEVSLHLLQDYPIWIGSHGSLEPLNLYKTCKLSFHTFIAHNYTSGCDTLKFNCMGHAPYWNSPNFISPKMAYWAIRHVFLPPKFPSIQFVDALLPYHLGEPECISLTKCCMGYIVIHVFHWYSICKYVHDSNLSTITVLLGAI